VAWSVTAVWKFAHGAVNGSPALTAPEKLEKGTSMRVLDKAQPILSEGTIAVRRQVVPAESSQQQPIRDWILTIVSGSLAMPWQQQACSWQSARATTSANIGLVNISIAIMMVMTR
jgi:hypothetical protein